MPRIELPDDPQGQLDAFLQRTADRKSPATHRAYSSLLNRLLGYVEVDDWADVTADDLEAFLNRPRKTATGKPAESSLNRDGSIIRLFFDFLLRRQVISYDPSDDMDPARGTQPEPREPVPDDTWLTVWQSKHTDMDDRVWLGLGYFCGLRRAEMAKLEPAGVTTRVNDDPNTGVLDFLRKGGKKRAGISYHAIITVLDHKLPHIAVGGQEWLGLLEWSARFRRDEQYLLADSTGDEAACRRIYDRFRYLQKLAGIQPADLVSPHNLRHSAATNLARCGVPKDIIKRQLSHQSEAMTERYITIASDLERWHGEQQGSQERIAEVRYLTGTNP